jgi:hypothetical protein
MQVFARHGVSKAQTVPCLQQAWDKLSMVLKLPRWMHLRQHHQSERHTFTPSDRQASVWRIAMPGSADWLHALSHGSERGAVPNITDCADVGSPQELSAEFVPPIWSDEVTTKQAWESIEVTTSNAQVVVGQEGLSTDRVVSDAVVPLSSEESVDDAAESEGLEKHCH